MFIHDSIKRLYSNMGYLPGYPYYMISDDEMFDAFLREDGFFNDNYPCPYAEPYPNTPFPPEEGPVPTMYDEYIKLRDYIATTIGQYQSGELETIPDWIYSYMLGNCIGIRSDIADLYYLNDLFRKDTTKGVPEFDETTATECFKVSYAWLKKQPTQTSQRPPSMFGELHVVKSLRLDQANILLTYSNA